jgi:glycerol-3-phosphate acyltransferase PlsX
MFNAPDDTGVQRSLSQGVVIALDCMGGDHAPDAIVEGADIARIRYPGVKFLLFGDKHRILPLLAKYPLLANTSEVRHTPDIIGNEVKPAVALRQGRTSSMRLAINAVNEGEAHCVVSAGNTGALMAMAKFVMKTLSGIERPAIASFFPTQRGESVMLDMGANVECDARNYIEFSIMGALFARTVLGIINPTIGLLNIGTEEMKGHEDLRVAATQLREMALPGTFVGFIEGDDIGPGKADVVVTDGFSGNVALKTMEGTAKLMTHLVRHTFSHSIFAAIGYLFARGAFHRLRDRMDPRKYNGAMLLGLRGICVKSHGGTDALGFANAIGVAFDLVKQDFNEKIRHELEKLGPLPTLAVTAAVPVAPTAPVVEDI